MQRPMHWWRSVNNGFGAEPHLRISHLGNFLKGYPQTENTYMYIYIYLFIYLFKCTPCFVPAYAFFPYYLSRRNHGLSFQLNLNDRFANTIKIKGFRGSCRTKIQSHSVAYHCPSLSCIHVAIIFRWSYNMEYDEELALPLHQQEDESERQAIQGFQRGSAGFKRVHYHSNQ